MSDFTLFSYSTSVGFTWWNLLPSAIGAVLGAACGAVPSYFLANRSSKALLARDEQARVQGEKVATIRAMTRLLTVVNGCEGLTRSVEEMIEEGNKRGGNSELWTVVRPISGMPGSPVHFEADEISIFLASKDYDFFNGLLLCATRYNSLTAGFADYAIQRQNLTDLLSAKMEGIVGSTDLSPEDAAFIAPKAAAVESLIVQLRETAEKDYEVALDLASQIGRKAQEYLSDPTLPALDVSEATKQLAARKARAAQGQGRKNLPESGAE
jgi:hypothetical protein